MCVCGFRSLNNSTSKRVLNLLEPVKLTVWKVVIERVRPTADMAVGPFSVTQPNTTHDFTDPTQPKTYVVTRDPTQPNPTSNSNIM